MKQILSVLLIGVLLIGLCACDQQEEQPPTPQGENTTTTIVSGDSSTTTTTTASGNSSTTTTTTTTTAVTTTTTAPKDDSYDRAVAALGKGKVGEAYRLLSGSADERAAEMLQHFVWQPLWSAGENPGSHTYDANGYPAASDWGMQMIYFTWDANGNLLLKRTEENSATHYWDETVCTYVNGYLVKRVRSHDEGVAETETFTNDANGNCLKWVYDSSYEPDNFTMVYTYDGNGNRLTEVCTKTDGYRSETTYTYNAAGQMLTKVTTYSDSRAAESVTRTYNDKGQMLTEKCVYSYGTEEEVYTYGERGELLQQTSTWKGEAPYIYRYVYDSYGRRTAMIVERDGAEINRTTIEYDDSDDTCLYVGGGETIEYQLFYYPHEITPPLSCNAAYWVTYGDPYIRPTR